MAVRRHRRSLCLRQNIGLQPPKLIRRLIRLHERQVPRWGSVFMGLSQVNVSTLACADLMLKTENDQALASCQKAGPGVEPSETSSQIPVHFYVKWGFPDVEKDKLK